MISDLMLSYLAAFCKNDKTQLFDKVTITEELNSINLLGYSRFFLFSNGQDNRTATIKCYPKNKIDTEIINKNIRDMEIVFDSLIKKEIDFLSVKGYTFSYFLYRDIFTRGIGDVDIIIDKKNMEEVNKIMYGLGYKAYIGADNYILENGRKFKILHKSTLKNAYHGHEFYELIKGDIGEIKTVFEFQRATHLLTRESFFKERLKNPSFFKIPNFSTLIPTLKIEYYLIFLFIHLYIDDVSMTNLSFPIKNYIDIAYMINNFEINYEECSRIGEELGIRKMIKEKIIDLNDLGFLHPSKFYILKKYFYAGSKNERVYNKDYVQNYWKETVHRRINFDSKLYKREKNRITKENYLSNNESSPYVYVNNSYSKKLFTEQTKKIMEFNVDKEGDKKTFSFYFSKKNKDKYIIKVYLFNLKKHSDKLFDDVKIINADLSTSNKYTIDFNTNCDCMIFDVHLYRSNILISRLSDSNELGLDPIKVKFNRGEI